MTSIICNKPSGIAVCAQCTTAITVPMLVIIRIKYNKASFNKNKYNGSIFLQLSLLFFSLFGCFLLPTTCSALFRKQNYHVKSICFTNSDLSKGKICFCFQRFYYFFLILNFLLYSRVFSV